MSIFTLLYNEILFRPLFNGLIFLYNVIPGHDFGVAIIVLTVITRFILYPLNQRAIRSQKEMQAIQPKVKEVQQKFKDDRGKQGQALMALYKEHKINPASGCLPLLVQFPLLIALLSVFRNGLNPDKLNELYRFVARPDVLNHMFLGLIDLSKANIFLAILAGIAQFIQSRMMTPKSNASGGQDFASMMNKQMLYIFPALTVFIAASLPAGLSIYWVAMTIFGIVQQYFVLRKKNGQPS
ncbi:MAG: YidC/Oxa1 family membrane protein insertase [bacterium]